MGFIIKLANYIDKNNLDTLITALMNLSIIGSAVWLFFSFKYKFDENIRNLYIEHSKKVYSILKNLSSRFSLDLEHEKLLKEALIEAETYLHNDIVNYVEEIRQVSISLKLEDQNLSKTNDDKKFLTQTENVEILFNKHSKIYRKFILTEVIKRKK